MILLEDAKKLKYGNIIHENCCNNADGSCRRWRVNGKVKTWKRDASKVRVPIKHGLRRFSYLTENDLEIVHRQVDCTNPKGGTPIC